MIGSSSQTFFGNKIFSCWNQIAYAASGQRRRRSPSVRSNWREGSTRDFTASNQKKKDLQVATHATEASQPCKSCEPFWRSIWIWCQAFWCSLNIPVLIKRIAVIHSTLVEAHVGFTWTQLLCAFPAALARGGHTWLGMEEMLQPLAQFFCS